MATSMISRMSSKKLHAKLLLSRNFVLESLNMRLLGSNAQDDKSDFFGIPEDFELQHFRNSASSTTKTASASESEVEFRQQTTKSRDNSDRTSKSKSEKSDPDLVDEYHFKPTRRDRRMKRTPQMNDYKTNFGVVSIDRDRNISSAGGNDNELEIMQIMQRQSQSIPTEVSRKSKRHTYENVSSNDIFQSISKQSTFPPNISNSGSTTSTSPTLVSKFKPGLREDESSKTMIMRNKDVTISEGGNLMNENTKSVQSSNKKLDIEQSRQDELWQGRLSPDNTSSEHTYGTTDPHFIDIDSQYFYSTYSDSSNSKRAPSSSFNSTVNHEVNIPDSSSSSSLINENVSQNKSEHNIFEDYYFPELASETECLPPDDRPLCMNDKEREFNVIDNQYFGRSEVSDQNSSEFSNFVSEYDINKDVPPLIKGTNFDSRTTTSEPNEICENTNVITNRKELFKKKSVQQNVIDDQYFGKSEVSGQNSSEFSNFVSEYDINKDVPPLIKGTNFDSRTTTSEPNEMCENTNVITNRKELFKKKNVQQKQNIESTSAFELAMKIRSDTMKASNSNQLEEEKLKASHVHGMSPIFQTEADKPEPAMNDSVTRATKQKLDSKGFRILSDQVTDFSKMPSMDILEILKKSIVFDHEDFLVIDKPYGLPSIGQINDTFSLSALLPALGRDLPRKYKASDLHIVQGLDRDVTGNIILAKNPEVAYIMKGKFKANEVIQRYWAITKGVPSPRRGIVDIPIGVGKVGNVYKMVIRPQYPAHEKPINKKGSKAPCDRAVTEYNVLSSHLQAALVECRLHTSGVKHQVRVHLSSGLNTPILGDHKYSHFSKLAPQKLDRTTLELLKVRQAKVRHISLHLHCHSLVLPDYKSQTYVITSHLPSFFARNMRSLKLYLPKK